MRFFPSRWMIAALALALSLPVMAFAQSAPLTCTPGSGYMTSYGGANSRSKIAYTAKVRYSFEQRLPDGNSVHAFTQARMARDSDGKTYAESGTGCTLDENGQPVREYNAYVYDPVSRTSWNWQVGRMNRGKMANIYHQPPPTPQRKLTPEELAAARKPQSRQIPRDEFKSVDLGIRTIAGTEAHGNRNIRTIPPGEEGNELPLVVVTETWNSTELGIVMLGIMDDPRHGKSTYEIEEVSRNPPDGSLFLPPADYKIVDVNKSAVEAIKP